MSYDGGMTMIATIAAGGLAALPLRAAGTKVRLGGPIFLRSTIRPNWRASIAAWATARRTARTRPSPTPRAWSSAFAAENVVIAEVGAWKNMLDPDAAKRKENLDYVTERCALAEAVGARCCVDIAGSYNPDFWYGMHPKNLSKEFFDATVENCRHVIDAVKPKRTKFTIEMMPWSLPDGPDAYVELIRAVDRPAFAVHLDVCNVINTPRRFYESGDVIRECFRKLGPLDRVMPREGPAVDPRVQRAFPGGRARAAGRWIIARTWRSSPKLPDGRAADARAPEERRRVRRGARVHPESGGRNRSAVRVTLA